MKHILPILTAALALTATTAFAVTTYNDETFLADSNYTEKYNQALSVNGGVYDFGDYQVVLKGVSRFTIHAVKNIDMYIYDFVDNVQSGDNSGNALNSKAQQVGYREVDSTGAGVVSSEKIHGLGTPTDSEVVQRNYKGPDAKPYDVVRNSYYLGQFEAGKDYEIYLETGGNGLWSSADYAGRYLVATDKLMAAYLEQSFENFSTGSLSSSQAHMPLAQVNGISFGMQSVAVGSPLPGGLQIAIIAGLFGFGFYYVRRRKAAAV